MTKNKRVTSYDVAREAGVSQSAVSRVFREGFSVSKKTRQKVTDTAKRLGYKPNGIARMLITQSSGMVAVIVSSRANLHYPEVLSLLNKAITKAKKRVLLFTLDEAEGLEDIIEQLWSFQVDGVIALAAHFDQDSLKQFKDHDIPVVLFNREVDDHSACSVLCNHKHGINQLVDKLYHFNHKNFLVVAGPSESDVAQDRLKHARDALEQKGISNYGVVIGDFSYESGRKAFAEYCQTNDKPTAVICANDGMAIGVIDEIREGFGLTVPNDISVVGFDGVNASKWYSYQLTTVAQPLAQMTKAAVDILIEQIECGKDGGERSAETRIWRGEFIAGASIGQAIK